MGPGQEARKDKETRSSLPGIKLLPVPRLGSQARLPGMRVAGQLTIDRAGPKACSRSGQKDEEKVALAAEDTKQGESLGDRARLWPCQADQDGVGWGLTQGL